MIILFESAIESLRFKGKLYFSVVIFITLVIRDGRTCLLEITSLFICFSDADLEDEEVDDPDEDELDEDGKEGDGDENAVVGGETYNEDENALSTPGDKSSDPVIPFILMGRRIIRRFRRRRGRGRRRFRFRRFRRRRSRG